jgi:biotin transport system substrate-specific component
MQSQAFVNKVLIDWGSTKIHSFMSYVVGVMLLTLLAQIAIPLPWTPVPITGQTFGVTLIALLWGQKRAFGIVSAYLIMGLVGFPVLALAAGSTWGYLIGMLLSTVWVGYLADRGWTASFFKTWFAGFMGSCIVFICGLTILSFSVPVEGLLAAGLLPFLPGDFIKTLTAATIAHRLSSLK